MFWSPNSEVGRCAFLYFKRFQKYCKKHHKNIINRDITTKYYLYLLYFTLVSFKFRFLLHINYEQSLNSDDGENPGLEMGTTNVTVFNPVNGVVGLWCLMPLSTIFQLYSENHRPVASNWQTLSHNVESSTRISRTGFKLATLVVLDTDCTCCKSNYHTMTPLSVNGIPPPPPLDKWKFNAMQI